MGESTYDSIIIAGERYKLGSGVRVVTWEDPDGYSFPSHSELVKAQTGTPLYGFRSLKGVGKVKTLAHLKEVLHQVILHADLTSDSLKCFKVLVDRNLSTHFMIDWDGTLYQGLDVLNEAYHAGDANNASVGVDVNNRMRNLVKEPNETAYNPKHPRYAEMTKKEFKRPKSRRKRINGAEVQSYGYTDAQYTALIELLKVLTKEFGPRVPDGPGLKPFPPLDAAGEIIPNTLEDGVAFEGFLGHYHVSTSRWDPGPAFDWERVYHGLAREHNAFPIEIDPGSNIATLLEPEKVQAYAERYYLRNEGDEAGGWYPMGINQTWHGGIHLTARKAGEPVYAMFDGKLVAGRFGKKPTELGHNNFMVLRHEIEVPGRQKDKTETFVFYSLYMHLLPIDVADTSASAPDWVRALHRIDTGKDDEEEEDESEDDEEDSDDDDDDDDYDDDYDDDDDDDYDDEDESEYASQAWLTVGQHIAAFKRGEISLVPWDERPVKVASGEQIGQVGEFGPPDEWSSMVHVEIFAEKGWKEAIDMGVHGRFLFEVEADVGSNLFVENRDILGLFEESRATTKAGSLVPERVLAPDDIAYFFNTSNEYVEEKRWLRKTVTRHVSEWSDQVDWVLALSSAEEWDARVRDFRKVMKQSGIFRDALRKTLPFIWLNRDVATHIGLDVEAWDGVLYHFHPIHFLMWLTYRSSQRIRVISRGKSLAQIKRELKKRQKAIARAKKRGEHIETDACELAAMDLEDVEFGNPKEVLEEWFEDSDQGEWRMPDRDEG